MKHHGFTLIELLVVIAMFALLLAILIPVLHSVRQYAKALTCSSHIRALTLGLIMYENRNEAFPYGYSYNFTPPPGGYAGYPDQDRIGWWWLNFLDGYVNEPKGKTTVFNCPSKLLNAPLLNDNILCGNYGVNLSICKNSDDFPDKKEFVGTPLGDEDIPNPTQTLLILDSGYSIISWWHATDVPPVTLNKSNIEDTAYVPGLKINKPRNLRPGQKGDAQDGRHPNRKVNAGFVDGHVARKKADDLYVKKEGDHYKNRSPLWVPE
jgi:prepilin-type N-terminal cleavage/methylation domain-containing protein/prepilin-type processing-associated H-X9-DG protein